MATDFENQGAMAIREVLAIKIARGQESRLGMKLLPMKERDETALTYERHRLMRGIQGARGMNAPTTPAQLPGFDKFTIAPGRFGNHFLITENDLENRRRVGSWTDFDSDASLTARATTLLNQLYLDRVEKNIFDLLLNGTITITDDRGVELYYDIYDIKKSTPSPLMSDQANSQPLRYLRELLELIERGTSVNFRGGSILMNRVTLNVILGNTNANDVGGLKMQYGSNVLSFADINEIFLANDLPKLEVYDEGYYPMPEGTAFQKFIPNGKALLLGKRIDGESIGEYTLTRAAQNGDDSSPGMWFTVRDERDRAPAKIILECGHNGGGKIFYPEGVCALSLY